MRVFVARRAASWWRGNTVFGLALALVAPMATAQVPYTPQQGLHYYALENLTTGRVEQRGVTGSNGVAHDNLILAPNTAYRHHILQAATLWTGVARFATPASGSRITLPTFVVAPSVFPDTDGDGLADDGELTMGTDYQNPDTDGDGVADGAEVQQGTNPVDGLPTRTGIIATADTPGTAVDVAALNDVVAVADSAAGVSVFNVFNGMNPVIIAQVDTPGTAQRVAISGALVAVADGDRGLAVIDVSDPPAAAIIHQVPLRGTVQTVAAGAGFAYVGASSGSVALVHLGSGGVLADLQLPEPVQDLRLDGDHLYALTPSRLHAIALAGGGLTLVGSADSPYVSSANERLFVGGGIAYAVHGKGYNTFDVGTPAAPRLIAAGNTAQFGWKQIVANGSGLGIAAVSPNRAFDGPHHVSLYGVSDPLQTNAFLTTFETPGVARALSIFNGLAYVADHAHGLQVVNYLAYDAQGVPPQIALSASFGLDPAAAEEGKLLRVTANVSDDVQVRNVEFYVDGVKVATDGNFPFEHRFFAPTLAEQPSFTLQARASDTGGNAVLTDAIVVTLVPDATPPRVAHVLPPDGALAGTMIVVAARFNEPIDAATLTADAFQLFAAGADGVPGNADDTRVGGVRVSHEAEAYTALLTTGSSLPPGRYTARVAATVADRAGNQMGAEHRWQFDVFDGPVPAVGFYSKRWTGDGNGTSWTDPANWGPTGAPGIGDDAYVPRGSSIALSTDASVLSLYVCAGASIALTTRTLSVRDSIRVEGVVNGGTVQITGSGATASGALSSLRVTGGARFSGAATIAGELRVERGTLDIGGQVVTVAGNVTIGVGEMESRLIMQAPGGELAVGGDIRFYGANSEGMLTAGVLRVGGDFQQSSRFGAGQSQVASPKNFAPGEDFRVVLSGTGAVSFADPRADLSRFHDIEIAPGATTTFSTGVVTGQLAVRPGAAATGTQLTLTSALGTTAVEGTYSVMRTVFTGQNQLLRGGIGYRNVTVMGSAVFSGAATIAGELRVERGTLDIGGQVVTVAGNVTIGVGEMESRLIMQAPGGELAVGGDIRFYGANSEGMLTAGVLRVGGDFQQSSRFGVGQSVVASPKNFAPGEDFRVVLTGTGAVSFADPRADLSRFHDVEIAPGATTTVNSDAVLIGSLDLAGRLTLPSNGVLIDVFGDLSLRAGAVLNNSGMLKYGGAFSDEGATINGTPPVPR